MWLRPGDASLASSLILKRFMMDSVISQTETTLTDPNKSYNDEWFFCVENAREVYVLRATSVLGMTMLGSPRIMPIKPALRVQD